mmetsp:Transcript_28867/g.45249  ORF Transcript_28867/g.45249 Transcript_28867/m.45249 type:complete len:299 (+) Transcript_28867:1377-2273(+)
MQESVPEEKAREYASYILNPTSRQSPKFASNFRYTAENRSMPYALEHAVQAVTRKIREVEGGCYLTWAATLDEDTRRLHFNSLVATYARSQYEKLDRPAPELPNDNQKTLENLLRTLPCVQELLLKANGVLENIVGDHFEIDDIVANLDAHDVHTYPGYSQNLGEAFLIHWPRMIAYLKTRDNPKRNYLNDALDITVKQFSGSVNGATGSYETYINNINAILTECANHDLIWTKDQIHNTLMTKIAAAVKAHAARYPRDHPEQAWSDAATYWFNIDWTKLVLQGSEASNPLAPLNEMF